MYLNTPMRKTAGKDVGDVAKFEIDYDAAPRIIKMPEQLRIALDKNPKAKTTFEALSPSRRHEIIRYIANLKSKAAIEKNVVRAIDFLQGEERFVGRDKP